MNKNDAAKKKADWLIYCLDIGWSKDDLDGLSELWDKRYDENGNVKPNQDADQPNQGEQGEMIIDIAGIMTASLLTVGTDEGIEKVKSQYHITRKMKTL